MATVINAGGHSGFSSILISDLIRTTAPEEMAPALRVVSLNRSGDAVRPFAAFGLEGLDLESEFLAQGSGNEAAHAVRLPAGCAHEVLQGRAAGAFQQGYDLGLFRVLPACVHVLLARGLSGGMPALGADLAAGFARTEALDGLPDPGDSHGPV